MNSAQIIGNLKKIFFSTKKRTFLSIGGVVLLLILFNSGGLIIHRANLLFRPTDYSKVPTVVDTFLSNDELKKVENDGMSFYLGDNPPNIEGKYRFDSLKLLFDLHKELQAGTVFVAFDYTFSNQNGTSIDFDSISVENVAGTDKQDITSAKNGYITGDGKCFSIFFEGKGSMDQCNYAVPIIMSGCISDKGITNFKEASIMKESTGECANIGANYAIMSTGNIRIMNESDGVAVKEQ